MRVDPVALVLLAAVFIIAQMRSISVKVRYGLMAAVFGLMAVLRLRGGGSSMNLAMGLVMASVGVFYAVKALRTKY